MFNISTGLFFYQKGEPYSGPHNLPARQELSKSKIYRIHRLDRSAWIRLGTKNPIE